MTEQNPAQLQPHSAIASPAAGAGFEEDGVAVQAALDEIVLSSLRPITGGVAILFLLLIGAHRLSLTPEIAALMMPAAGLVAVLVGLMRIALDREKVPASKAHALAGVMALLVLAHVLLQLFLTREPEQTAVLLLVVMGAGIFFLDVGWFAVIVSGGFLGWMGVMNTAPDASRWLSFGIALVGVSVLAGAVLYQRRQTFIRIEALHFQDRLRQLELETALERTETARRGEAEARRELEAAFQKIRESEERFRRLADATFEGVIVHREGRIQDANRRAAEMVGHHLDDLIGKELGVLLHPDHRSHTERELDSRLSGEGSDVPVESIGFRGDGSTFPLEIQVAPAFVEGEPVVVTVLRDATRQKRAEQILREAAEAAEESNRAKSAFLANMSHELRTPLNAVIGFSNILKKNKDGSFSERDVEYLDRIVSNGKHLLALINDVLDLSKIEAGRMELVMEEVDVEELAADLHRSFELQARRKGIGLKLEVPARSRAIKGDGHRLKQVLYNLVGNAMKFTDEGAVTLRVVTTDDGVTPRRLEVVDSGIGIPDERIREIFDPFQQVDASTSRKYGGTGLGLAISRSLCEMMGFTLGATSTVGEGSTFAIDFMPATPPKPPITSELVIRD